MDETGLFSTIILGVILGLALVSQIGINFGMGLVLNNGTRWFRWLYVGTSLAVSMVIALSATAIAILVSSISGVFEVLFVLAMISFPAWTLALQNYLISKGKLWLIVPLKEPPTDDQHDGPEESGVPIG